MTDFRSMLKARDVRRLAPAGELCALFAALCAAIFTFLIGFDGTGRVTLLGLFAPQGEGGAFGVCAAALSLAAECALLVLTLLRYVRFLRGKSRRDSLYFSYAVCAGYLAALMLFSACAAKGTLRLNGATVAGLCLVGAGVLASVILFLLAKGREPAGEAVPRVIAAVTALLLLLAMSALFSTGAVASEDRAGLCVLYAETAPGGAAVCFFLFLIGYAVCGVLLAERLLGNIAQQRKPILLRASLTALFALLAAICEASLATGTDEILILFVWGVPAFTMLAALLLVLAVLADTLHARARKNTADRAA